MPTESLFHNFVIKKSESVQQFIESLDAAEEDVRKSKDEFNKYGKRCITDDEILALMARKKEMVKRRNIRKLTYKRENRMEENIGTVKQLYCIYLYDYACPGFITAYKPFYGSAQEIEYYLSQQSKNMSKIIDEIVKFEVLVHCSQEYLALNYEWAHKNAWGYWYHFRCKKLRTQHYWISYNCFYKRIVSVWAEELKFKSPRDKNFEWMEIDMH